MTWVYQCQDLNHDRSVHTLERPTQALQKHLSLYMHYLIELQERFYVKTLYIQRHYNLADLNSYQAATCVFQRLAT